jgi:hypothetical protein
MTKKMGKLLTDSEIETKKQMERGTERQKD